MGKAGSELAPSLALVSSQGPGHSRVVLGQFAGPIRSTGGSPFLVLRGPATVPFAFRIFTGQFLLLPLIRPVTSGGIRNEFGGVSTAPLPLTCMGSAASSHLPRAPLPPACSLVGSHFFHTPSAVRVGPRGLPRVCLLSGTIPDF